jgi:hypothetical protein
MALYCEWRWRAISELPERDKKSKFWDSEAASYQAMLAGQPARHALQKMGSAFHFLRQVLEPSSLTRTAAPPIVTSL